MFSSWPHLSSSDTSILCFLLTVVQSYLLFLFCFGFFSQGKVWNKKLKKDLTSQVSVTCILPFISWPRWFFFFNITVQEIHLSHQHLLRLDVPFSMDCTADWSGHVTFNKTSYKQPFIPDSIYSLHSVLNWSHNCISSLQLTGTFYHWCPAKQYQSYKWR